MACRSVRSTPVVYFTRYVYNLVNRVMISETKLFKGIEILTVRLFKIHRFYFGCSIFLLFFFLQINSRYLVYVATRKVIY